MGKKRCFAAIVLTVLAAGCLIACGGKKGAGASEMPVAAVREEEAADTKETAESLLEAELTWWTYPVFAESEPGEYEKKIAEDFQKLYPNIKISVEMLDYETGPERVRKAAEEGNAPDILLDEPGRIREYAEQGLLQNLDDLMTREQQTDLVSEGVQRFCRSEDGFYMLPLCMADYVMAFNRDMLETCGALELLDLSGDRTWNTEVFEQVMEKLHNSGFPAGILYCSGVGGDYGTRAFVTNLYDTPLKTEGGSGFAFQGETAEKTLQKLKDWEAAGWIINGSGETGAGAVEAFVNGTSAFTVLWGLPQSLAYAEQLEENGVRVLEMPYPSEDQVPNLEYNMTGCCIFVNQDQTRMEAADYFAKYLCLGENSAEYTAQTGMVSAFLSVENLYPDNEETGFYESMRPFSGEGWQAGDQFESMRICWYRMLAEVLNGESSPKEAADSFTEYGKTEEKQP